MMPFYRWFLIIISPPKREYISIIVQSLRRLNCRLFLYNVPGRTGVNMNAETTLRLAKEYPNIIAIKEASGNITQMDDIIKNKPADFMVISGDDGITFPLLTLGGRRSDFCYRECFPERVQQDGEISVERRFSQCFVYSSSLHRIIQPIVCRWKSGRS